MEGGEWGSFNTVCVNEEADFMAQLFPNTNDVQVNYGHNCSNNGEGGSYYSPDSTSQSQNNLYCFSQESISYRSGHESNYNNFLSDHHHHHHHHHAASLPFDFLHCQMDGDNGLTGDDQEESPVDPVAEDKNSDSCENSKKRGRVSDVQKEKRKGIKGKKSQIKKGFGGGDIEEEENHEVGVNRQSSSCGSLEDDCSSKGTTTTTNTATALNSNGKTRASRGSATDPQSLYARKRRERINERLKILQSLVPNGTKVDISTMLEEAVQYVKFLQLQIKLLSSDDLWMYAPIAYNGMNIGLDFNINIPR